MVSRIGQLGLQLPLVALLGACLALAACGGSTANPTPPGADVEIVSRAMAFIPDTISVAGNEPFTIRLVNEDAAPHNVAIFVGDSGGEKLFTGELISSATVTYELPPLAAGTYFFHCDLHPEMTGTLLVED